MAAAIRLTSEYFWPHARAALRQIGLTDRHRHLRRVLRWIKANGHTEVSLKDVRREAVGGILDAEQTRDLIDRLETAGWLRPKNRNRRTSAAAVEDKPENFSACRNCRNCRNCCKAAFVGLLQFLHFLQSDPRAHNPCKTVAVARCPRQIRPP